ncbi:MAG: tetratricopeptide repeat protein [Deltaproteobacteria bacterium]|jgi:Flp pilus assembly protein TadD|nr:tetratricopeptide repeat protein [Deltaproteobacteria bacterium]
MPRLTIVTILALTLAALTGCRGLSGSKLTTNQLLGLGDWPGNQAIMRAAENTGNYDLGLDAGQRELETRPDNKEARVYMAKLQTMAGRPEQALYTIEPITSGADALPAALIEKARALLRQGFPLEARPILQSLAGTGGLSREEERSVQKLLGICEDQEGRRSEAQAIFRQLLLEKDEPSVRYNLGGSLISSENYDEALSVLRPLIDSPRYLEARIMAAAALNRKRDNKGARELLEGYVPEREINRILGVPK